MTWESESDQSVSAFGRRQSASAVKDGMFCATEDCGRGDDQVDEWLVKHFIVVEFGDTADPVVLRKAAEQIGNGVNELRAPEPRGNERDINPPRVATRLGEHEVAAIGGQLPLLAEQLNPLLERSAGSPPFAREIILGE